MNALLLVSTAFVMTVFGYLISPVIQRQALESAPGGPGPGSRALADWLERRAPAALAVEVSMMVVSGLLAMATENWFSTGKRRGAGSRAV